MLFLLGVIGLVALKDNASTAAVATIISALVAGLVSYLTKRSSDQANVAISETTTRGDIEREAFERAQKFYTDTIDRQVAELGHAETEIANLKARIAGCESQIDGLRSQVIHYRRSNQRLARGVHELRLTLGQAATDKVLDEAVMDAIADEPDDA